MQNILENLKKIIMIYELTKMRIEIKYGFQTLINKTKTAAHN